MHELNKKVFSILVTFLFINQFSIAQKIEPGKYVSVWKYNHFTGETVYNGVYGENITILDSVNLIYRYRDDITDIRGGGIYKLGNKFLNVELTGNNSNIDTTNFIITDSIKSDTDSLLIQMEIKDKYTNLIGALIRFYSIALGTFKSSSNEDGICSFKIHKNFLPLLIKVDYVGYKNVMFYIERAYNLKITVTMDMFYKLIREKKYITYSIKEIDIDGFYLKGGIFSEWTFFKKEK